MAIQQWNTPPALEIDPQKNYRVSMNTARGVIEIDLYPLFIRHSPQPHLNGKHTVFGKVTQGQDVVNAIRQGDKINKVTITEA